jgi:hypothetical protein
MLALLGLTAAHFMLSIASCCTAAEASSPVLPPNTSSLFLPTTTLLCPSKLLGCVAVSGTSHMRLSRLSTAVSRPTDSCRRERPPCSTSCLPPAVQDSELYSLQAAPTSSCASLADAAGSACCNLAGTMGTLVKQCTHVLRASNSWTAAVNPSPIQRAHDRCD